MSNLNPGGFRGGGPRVFGDRNIRRACADNRIPDADRANGSIADQPHKGSREQQRRLRQEARKRTPRTESRCLECCEGNGSHSDACRSRGE